MSSDEFHKSAIKACLSVGLGFAVKGNQLVVHQKGFPKERGKDLASFSTTGEIITVPIAVDDGDDLSLHLACFLTNVEGQGELETVLKAIKTKASRNIILKDSMVNVFSSKNCKDILISNSSIKEITKKTDKSSLKYL